MQIIPNLSKALLEQFHAVKAQSPENAGIAKHVYAMYEEAKDLERFRLLVTVEHLRDTSTRNASPEDIRDWLQSLLAERQEALEALISLFSSIQPDISEDDLTVPRLHAGILKALEALPTSDTSHAEALADIAKKTQELQTYSLYLGQEHCDLESYCQSMLDALRANRKTPTSTQPNLPGIA